MRRVILFVVLTAFGMNASAREKSEWMYVEGKIDKVYEIASNSKSTELLRIYGEGTYEHLRYAIKSDGREEVERQLGRYEIRKSKITFHVPERKMFSGKFKFGTFFFNGKLYNSFLDLKFRKQNEAFRRTKNQKYFKPFFICLTTDEVVNNNEAAEHIDLKRLVDFILLGKRTETEKVMSIIQLIVGSVEYDYVGLDTDKYANRQNDIRSILAGQNRVAVCAGYAYTFAELCELAGIQAEDISGYTKQGFGQLGFLGGYHAWNIAEIEGKKRLYDVTWADNGEHIDMKWIDVDPLVMIGSHLPINPSNQLLEKPIMENQFLSGPVVFPMKDGADPVTLNIAARQFAGKNFTIALSGRHRVTAKLYPAQIAELVYRDEAAGKLSSYTPKNVGTGHYTQDSTFFTVPLMEAINPLEIEIDGQIEVKTLVYKGGQTDLMKYYISRADSKYCDSYIKGVIAAIRISDEKALKELVGDDISLLFDKKGKLKIDKKLMLSVLDWTGDLTSLTRVHSISTIHKQTGDPEIKETSTLHIDIPNKLRFELGFNGQHYAVTKIEFL
jgi:hypothetical protein